LARIEQIHPADRKFANTAGWQAGKLTLRLYFVDLPKPTRVPDREIGTAQPEKGHRWTRSTTAAKRRRRFGWGGFARYTAERLLAIAFPEMGAPPELRST
jgi:hypothetical protein